MIENGKCGVMTVNGEKSYQCLLCDKIFSRPYRIQRHLQVHDPSRAKVECHICSKQFTRVDTLQTHLRSVHTDEKPFSCSFPNCAKRFAVQSALVHHLKVSSYTNSMYSHSFTYIHRLIWMGNLTNAQNALKHLLSSLSLRIIYCPPTMTLKSYDAPIVSNCLQMLKNCCLIEIRSTD